MWFSSLKLPNNGPVVGCVNTADIDKPVSNAVSSAIITATTDMATKTYVNQKDNLKADKATTLSGYGITDAYTKDETHSKTEINSALSLKASVNYVDGKDGDLTTLTTTDKTSLVNALNEINDSLHQSVNVFTKRTNGFVSLFEFIPNELHAKLKDFTTSKEQVGHVS